MEPQSDNSSAHRGFEKFEKLGAIPARTVKEVLQIMQERKIPERQVNADLTKF